MNFKIIFDSLPEYYFIVDSSLKIKFVNKSASEFYGFLFGKKLLEGDIYLEYSDLAKNAEAMLRVEKAISGKPCYHTRIVNAHKQKVLFKISYLPLEQPGIHDCCLVKIENQSDSAMYEGQNIGFNSYANDSLLFWQTNPENQIIYFSRSFIDFLGITENEGLEKSLLNRIHPDDIAKYSRLLHEALENKKSFTHIYRIKDYKNKYKWLREIATLKYNIKGEFSGFTGVCIDISDLKNAEAAWQSEKEFNMKITRLLPDNIYLYDLIEKKNVYQNKKVTETLGYKNDDREIDESIFLEILHPDDIPIIAETINKIKNAKDDEVIVTEFRFKDAQGYYRWFQSTDIVFKRDASGQPTQSLGSIRDITSRKEDEINIITTNEELKKANAELDSFVYRASHDLKAPLTSIKGLISIIKSLDTNDELQKLLYHAELSTDKMMDVIRDITDHSKNIRTEIQKDEFSIGEMVGNIHQSLAYMTRGMRVDFVVNENIESKFVSDKYRVGVILNNLISNALRYFDAEKNNPYVVITIFCNKNEASITVEDNGIGISEKIQPKIFDMFYRGTSISGGTGLGLYIVKEMVQKLNGNLLLQAEEGRGAKFTVTIPNHV